MKKLIYLLIFILAFANILFAQAPRSYTSSEILLQIKKLNTVGSVLYIAAHPDDENTQLIAYLANEKCLRTGYLSLTRGDGGQNLIGSEKGVELGVIRTQELLAARRIDGGEQFFTRAYDFGYSKSPKETFSKWNKDSLLSDVVWVIRNFRPDIIITRFATDGSGGHGHHTASAILAEEAFDAAADSTRFPEQLEYVSVWKTRRMFWNVSTRFANPNADMSPYIKLDVGGYNPLLGKSYGEIAAESRSMHKSQGMGTAAQRGEYFEYFKPLKGDTTDLKDIFEGMDFTRKDGRNKKIIDKAIKKYLNNNIQDATNSLVKLYFEGDKNIPKNILDKYFPLQQNYYNPMLLKIILNMNGIMLESFVEGSDKYSGDSITIKAFAINRSNLSISLKDINLSLFDKISSKELNGYELLNIVLKKNVPSNKIYNIKLPDVVFPSSMNWLIYQPVSNKFIVNEQTHVGKAYYLTTGINVRYRLIINGKHFTIYDKVIVKSVDPERGELYNHLIFTPPVMINLQQKCFVFGDEKEKEIKIVIKAGQDSVKGIVFMEASRDKDWIVKSDSEGIKSKYDNPEVAHIDFSLNKKGEEKIVSFFVKAPANNSESKLKLTASLQNNRPHTYTKGMKEIKYDHIPIQTLFPEAEAKLVRLDVNKKIKRLGYIPGAGDEVQSCLSQLGYEVITITDDMLTKENLSQFESIITGVRAYNTNEKLSTYKQKLMDYVSNGGNLIVQYNTNSFVGPFKGDIGPYPFKITRDRVTDENASVNFELPNHPVLNTPNKITSADFAGWIQERCIYTAGDVDAKYEMPLSMADPDEKANKGSLIIAKHGKGSFIYTGLAFFRELPAGVPGAYRLLVNMIELGK